uniref:MADS-box domain-containing protein n=1 Tax=Ascaris lumbricoides TaxID=6252 RepID=A0A0M3I742_ASCLU
MRMSGDGHLVKKEKKIRGIKYRRNRLIESSTSVYLCFQHQ